MRTHFALSLCLLATSACVTYDKKGELDTGTYDYGDDYGDPGGDSGDVDQAPDVTLSFRPYQAEQGEAFIGYITVSEGELDLSEVEELQFFGDVEIISQNIRDDEIIVSMLVPDLAETGDIDLVAILPNQSVIYLDAAFTVYPAGSGNLSGDGYGDIDDADDCP
jgi:hypothetical protein